MSEIIIPVIIGFLLALIPGWFDRKRKIKSHLAALRAEIRIIKEKSEIYLKDNVVSPLVRLPTETFKTSYAILLAEGVLEENEIHGIGIFYSQVQDINRGFDNLAAALASRDHALMEGESVRCNIKVNKLVTGNDALYTNVEEILNEELCKYFWQY